MNRSRFKVSHHPLPPPLKKANVWYATQLKGINLKNISTCQKRWLKGPALFLPPFLSSLITVQIEGHHKADERKKIPRWPRSWTTTSSTSPYPRLHDLNSLLLIQRKFKIFFLLSHVAQHVKQHMVNQKHKNVGFVIN